MKQESHDNCKSSDCSIYKSDNITAIITDTEKELTLVQAVQEMYNELELIDQMICAAQQKQWWHPSLGAYEKQNVISNIHSAVKRAMLAAESPAQSQEDGT